MNRQNIKRAALIGNPNCGKTTLFNGLTGTHQRVGNWPGVTVDKKTGLFKLADGSQIELVDLPGIYSLEQEHSGIDEQIAHTFLKNESIDFIINIVDASCLDRQLLLTHQLREFQVPMLVVVNMLDVAASQQVKVDLDTLSKQLGLPVVGIVAAQSTAVEAVKACLQEALVAEQVEIIKGDDLEKIQQRLAVVAQWVSASVSQAEQTVSVTERIDRLVLNRFLSVPIFLLVMYLLFTFAINVGAVFIDFFDIFLGAWLVDGVHQLFASLHLPDWSAVIVADGLGGGVQLVGTFIPVVGFLYLGLSLLEGSGYIARAAFVVDRMMQAIGLPGKAFVPLIVGFGCNVPSVMATRTLDRQSDRLVTMAMAPFMSCGARLPVYALFAAAFFGTHSQNVVFGLYLMGIAMAIATGWVFRKALYKGDLSSSVMEMPVYHLPAAKNILMNTWHRLKGFVKNAGKTIVIVVVALSFLNSWGTDGSFGNEDSEASVLSAISMKVTPVLAPMGVQTENWPATVGVITGIFAKEAVVGTLDSLYTDVASQQDVVDEEALNLWAQTIEAFASIGYNTLDLTGALMDPLGIRVGSYDSIEQAAEEQEVSSATFVTMLSLFVTPFAAFCYLVFILLYTPCVAVIGALVREAGPRWAWVVVSWSTVLAYATATILYQAGTIVQHWLSSSLWIAAMLALMSFYIWVIKQIGKPSEAVMMNRIPLRDVGAQSRHTC
ncbi:ferrous iron transport protein B [Reinekea thalattae]|uniref:Ferrous iron transport protein B n=1 Tax=Reinekea thalattae TaxID=2593301 RepID=A0A5C8Z8H0_9GAMM|nr:ferrous iron transport protein B [Reinekea thalattae]TXR53629.1 ferrous iron transport protein B [Reinekea thalattae]